jgi:hypothetical protein
MIDETDEDDRQLRLRAVELSRDFDPNNLPDDVYEVIADLLSVIPDQVREGYLAALAERFGLVRLRAEQFRAEGLAEGDVRDELFGALQDYTIEERSPNDLTNPFFEARYISAMKAVYNFALAYPNSTEQ